MSCALSPSLRSQSFLSTCRDVALDASIEPSWGFLRVKEHRREHLKLATEPRHSIEGVSDLLLVAGYMGLLTSPLSVIAGSISTYQIIDSTFSCHPEAEGRVPAVLMDEAGLCRSFCAFRPCG